MNVDFLHNQIIRDTISGQFIESFNENLLPLLFQKYGKSLEHVQFYEDHIKDGMRIGGIFYYPLTVVINSVPKTEWISWQVSNYRIYDNFNPFTYKGQELLSFSLAEKVPEGLEEKIVGKPIYSHQNSVPVILKAESDDKTFLAGKYAQGFIDLMSAAVTELIENELAITGLAGSGVVVEMNFAPGTYMEHISASSTYRRLRIKARACSARDLWVKWTRLDGNGTYTISDNVDNGMIKFELAENLPGKVKEKEYRYLTAESIEKYQQSMSRKNITEWREMMRRVLHRGEVEKFERITISKTSAAPEIEDEEPILTKEEESVPVTEQATVSAVKIPSAAERDRDDITQRLNALLGKPDVEFSREPETIAQTINADLTELLKGAIAGASMPTASEETTEEQDTVEEITERTFEEAQEEESCESEQPTEEVIAQEAITQEVTDTAAEKEKEENAPAKIDHREIEERIRRELEEKMKAEMDELRKKNEEAEQLRAKLEATKKAEAREKELLAEAARQAVLDAEKREADRRAEAERDRIEAERKAELERIEEENRRKEAEAKAEAERIEAERISALEKAKEEAAAIKPVFLTKKVNLIFRRAVVDKNMAKKVHEIIIATIKHLEKENVYMRIKANIPDAYTLTLTFSEIPLAEQQLVVDIIQVLGKSGLGIIKATLD